MSDYVEPYDPSAPEGEVTHRGQYITKRDIKVVGIVLFIVMLALIPTYRYLKGNSEKARCTQNLQAMASAISEYATEHDGRYPPVARTESIGSVAPSLSDSGRAYTWASDIAGYMTVRASFLCPTATPDEVVATEDPRKPGATLLTSYGMYEPYGGFLTSLVENQDQAAVIVETSNRGGLSSYDPLPLVSSDGKPLPDGFVVGWNDSNDDSTSSTAHVTRLAFPETQNGVFKGLGPARHGNLIHILTAEGSLLDANPSFANFRDIGSTKAVNTWNVPAGWKSHMR